MIPFVARSTRDSRDAGFLASVVSAIPCCVPARIEGTNGHVPTTSQDDGDDNDVKPTRPSGGFNFSVGGPLTRFLRARVARVKNHPRAYRARDDKSI